MTKKILVIEDSSFQRKVIMSFLREEGYEPSGAKNGQDGLVKFDLEQPDIVILDLVMPVMDGFQVLETLKERGVTTPLIVLTSDIQLPVRVQCASLGARGFVNKPLNRDELRKAIQEVSS